MQVLLNHLVDHGLLGPSRPIHLVEGGETGRWGARIADILVVSSEMGFWKPVPSSPSGIEAEAVARLIS